MHALKLRLFLQILPDGGSISGYQGWGITQHDAEWVFVFGHHVKENALMG